MAATAERDAALLVSPALSDGHEVVSLHPIGRAAASAAPTGEGQRAAAERIGPSA